MLVLERSLKVFISFHCSACFSISCTHFGWSLQRKTGSSHTSCQAFLTLWQNCAFHKCHCECWSEENSVSTKKTNCYQTYLLCTLHWLVLGSSTQFLELYVISKETVGVVPVPPSWVAEFFINATLLWRSGEFDFLGGIPIMFCEIYSQDYCMVWEQGFSLFSVLHLITVKSYITFSCPYKIISAL